MEQHTEPISADSIEFWSGRYARSETPWDLGEVSPPFAETVETLKAEVGPHASIAVIGCGRGHEASFFAKEGFQVTGIDFSPLAIEEAKALYGDSVNFEEADLFNLPAHLHHQFDVVVEHTCFCAILPSRRTDYVQGVAKLLKPQGMLLALFYCHSRPDGPPYGATETGLQTLFTPKFQWISCQTPSSSVSARAGDERLVWMRLLHDADQV